MRSQMSDQPLFLNARARLLQRSLARNERRDLRPTPLVAETSLMGEPAQFQIPAAPG